MNCRIFPYWVLALIPEENLKQVLKNNKCKYDLKKKHIYKQYQSAVAKILLQEAKWLEIKKQVKKQDIKIDIPIKEIKQAITRNLFRISINTKELAKIENIL